jgi:large subunit ribosomal protein L9
MKVILKKTVENLGEAGEVVQVRDGFGRNYLLPQGLAYVASEANIARLEAEQAQAQERSRRDFLEARRRATQLEGLSLVFRERAGEDGKLFGSVTKAHIAERVSEGDLDFVLERKLIDLDEPLKALGVTNVPIRLHPDVVVEIEVHVEREES